MKTRIGSVVIAAVLAAPALAELSPIVIPKGVYTIAPAEVAEGTRGENDEGIYNNLHRVEPQTQYHIPNNDDGSGPGSGRFVGDDLHMTGNTFTGFRWVYTDPGTIGDSTHSSMLVFSNNTANDGVGPLDNIVTYTSGGITHSAAFLITGLPGDDPTNPAGGWLITLPLPTLVADSNDIWVGLSSNSMTSTGNRGLRGTSLTPSIGSGHNLHWQTSATGTSFFSVAPPGSGSFRMVVLPEPDAAVLLVLGTLAVLWRPGRG